MDVGADSICPPDCTLHSLRAHEASAVLRRINAFPAQCLENWQSEGTDEVLYWLKLQNSETSPSSPSSQVDTAATGAADPTWDDAVLLRLCKISVPSHVRSTQLTLRSRKVVNFVSRFKASLDGDPDIASNLYMKQYVPFCLQSNLLIQTAIYTSACFLNETKPRVGDSNVAMIHKYRAIRMLNEHIQTQRSTTDEAIAAVMQMMLNEWYWGNTSDLTAHLSGLKEMIRLRGGFRNLGLGGLLARLVMM